MCSAIEDNGEGEDHVDLLVRIGQYRRAAGTLIEKQHKEVKEIDFLTAVASIEPLSIP